MCVRGIPMREQQRHLFASTSLSISISSILFTCLGHISLLSPTALRRKSTTTPRTTMQETRQSCPLPHSQRSAACRAQSARARVTTWIPSPKSLIEIPLLSYRRHHPPFPECRIARSVQLLSALKRLGVQMTAADSKNLKGNARTIFARCRYLLFARGDRRARLVRVQTRA